MKIGKMLAKQKGMLKTSGCQTAINGGEEMTKYRAICGNTSRTIKGCTSLAEALKYAIKCYDDCLDHTDSVDLYDMEGNYLCGEDN